MAMPKPRMAAAIELLLRQEGAEDHHLQMVPEGTATLRPDGTLWCDLCSRGLTVGHLEGRRHEFFLYGWHAQNLVACLRKHMIMFSSFFL